MQSIEQFITANGIGMSCKRAPNNPNMADKHWPARHWRCLLRRGRHRMTIPFSQGLGISGEPSLPDVLDCLASDAAGHENARDFADWAGEYGYDEDSRSAERVYRVIGTQAGKLKRFLGADQYEALLWETERE